MVWPGRMLSALVAGVRRGAAMLGRLADRWTARRRRQVSPPDPRAPPDENHEAPETDEAATWLRFVPSPLASAAKRLDAGARRAQRRRRDLERKEAEAAGELLALIALIEATAWPPAFKPNRPYPPAFQNELFGIAVEIDAWVEQERTRAFLRAGARVTEGLDHTALVAALGVAMAYRVFNGLYAVSTGQASGPYARLRALLQQRNWLNRRFGLRSAG